MKKNIKELKEHPLNKKVYGTKMPDMGFINRIKMYGLQNPIKINQDNIIISGHRRYMAAKFLELDTVEVIVIETKNERDLTDRLILDNDYRKVKSISIRTKEAMVLENKEKEKAKEKQKSAGGDKKSAQTGSKSLGKKNSHPVRGKKTSEKAAESMSVSAPTYTKIKYLVEKADGGDKDAIDVVENLDNQLKPNVSKGLKDYEKKKHTPTEQELAEKEMKERLNKINKIARNLFDGTEGLKDIMSGGVPIETDKEKQVVARIAATLEMTIMLALELGVDIDRRKKVFQIEDGRKNMLKEITESR